MLSIPRWTTSRNIDKITKLDGLEIRIFKSKLFK